jgi:hypothetical protein
MTSQPDASSQSYERPTLTVVGPVQTLTRQIDKTFGPTDGFTFMGIGITNASP